MHAIGAAQACLHDSFHDEPMDSPRLDMRQCSCGAGRAHDARRGWRLRGGGAAAVEAVAARRRRPSFRRLRRSTPFGTSRQRQVVMGTDSGGGGGGGGGEGGLAARPGGGGGDPGRRAAALLPILGPDLSPGKPPPPVPVIPKRVATMVDSTGDGRADLLLIDLNGDGTYHIPSPPLPSVLTPQSPRTSHLIPRPPISTTQATASRTRRWHVWRWIPQATAALTP